MEVWQVRIGMFQLLNEEYDIDVTVFAEIEYNIRAVNANQECSY